MYPLAVPYKTFAPGLCIGWESSLEMCQEMFHDLEVPWVQDFVLRSRPCEDAYALTDPANFSRAISIVWRNAALPDVSGGFTATVELVRLEMPVTSNEDIGACIGVSITSVGGSGDVFAPGRVNFIRCVTNNRNHSKLTIVDHLSLGVITAPYYGYGKDGLWYGVLSKFNRKAFFEAFDEKNKKVNFEKINQSLIQSIVGGVKHKQRPAIMTNNLYPNNMVENVGDHLFKTIFTSHANGQVMMTFPVFNNASWSVRHDGAALREMLKWGITERMQQIRLSPDLDLILTSCNSILNEEVERTAERLGTEIDPESSLLHLDEPANVANNEIENFEVRHRSDASLIRPSSATRLTNINIAPRPTPKDDENGYKVTAQEQLDHDELRKIRNRAAAARSYEKKRAAKRAGKMNR